MWLTLLRRVGRRRTCSRASILLLALAGCHRRGGRSAANGDQSTPSDLPRKVTVEVLNSGGNIGAARVGTLLLRRARLDVVYFGNADSAQSGRVHNQVLVRRGDTTGVGRVIAALGTAEVVEAPEPARLVDLTVLLGKEFAAVASPRP
jgi:hypothetical protein